MVELAASAGLILDEWQSEFMHDALLERPDGSYAASDVGLCVTRQNGKGSILEAVELADLFLLDTTETFHTAHLFDTSKEALQRLLVLIESTPDLDRYFSSHGGRVWLASGQEGLQMIRNGKKRRLKFKTRTKGSVRGLTGDRIVVDEAMYYTAEMDAALRPAISARSMQQNTPQVWLVGSAGDRTSTEFGRMRRDGLAGEDPRLVWAEWSIEPCSPYCGDGCTKHDDPEDPQSWAKANPGLGIRISPEQVAGEMRRMDREMFLRERLGVGDWPVEGEAFRVIDKDSWMDRFSPLSRPSRPLVFAADSPPDRSRASIVVAGRNDDGLCHIEITSDQDGKLDCRRHTDWIVPRIIELNRRWKPAAVVLDKGTHTGSFIDELEAAGVPLLLPQVREYAQGCAQFVTDIIPRVDSPPQIVHLNQPKLTDAVADADQRDLADVWAWDKRNASTDISPLVAATLAYWGYRKIVNRARPVPDFAWG